MNALTLNEALQLYEIIGEYVPDVEDMDAVEFVGTIVGNIRESGQHKDYVDAVMLMSGKPWKEIKEMLYDEVLELFISGLSVNRVVELKSFCDAMRYNYA